MRIYLLEDGKRAGKLPGMFGHLNLVPLLSWGLPTKEPATRVSPSAPRNFVEVKEDLFLLEPLIMIHGMTPNKY